MAPQLTLQAPLELPPTEVQDYLNRLWEQELRESTGAATFTLLVWEPSWLEQQLIRTGRISGPLSGLLHAELLEAARRAVVVLTDGIDTSSL
ncbi:MAG: glucose 6-phosphate dehydrogenase, partial [Vulcanococcus sp.]